MEATRATRLDLRSIWPNEAADFTPWLAEHLEWLSEDLNLGPLTFEAREVAVSGGRSLDILAIDSEGRAVAIENQYGVVDHDHLTRGLAYAVALQSSDRPVSALVVVAEDHRDEFVAVADYLNECAAARGDQGTRVFLVTVTAERIGESESAIHFTARAEPNDWQAEVRRGALAALVDVEAFLALLDEGVAETARAIVDPWPDRDGASLRLSATSLGLYARNHRAARGRCNVANLYGGPTPTIWLNPGRLQESGAFTESEMQELGRRVAQHLPPTTTVGGKGFFLAFPLPEVDPGALAQLFDWILQILDRDGDL